MSNPFKIVSSILNQPDMDTTSFQSVVDNYTPTAGCHQFIVEKFVEHMRAVPQYINHREWILANRYGFGEHAFHWMWKLIVDSMPQSFKFLEIGVYCGQVTSLVQMLATEQDKNVEICGVTPMEGGGPENHLAHNYSECIKRTYDAHGITMDNTTFVVGYSTDAKIISQFDDKQNYYDIVFIDGSHVYEDVVSDMKTFDGTLKIGGLMITDDSSNQLPMPAGYFAGIAVVSKAVEDTIAIWPYYKHLFACMHDRVWRKI